MSLFNRPAWAHTQSAEDDETEDSIFSHSKSSYSRIVADEQQRKKKQLEKQEKQRIKKERKERKSSVKHEVKEEQQSSKVGGSPKRRRITREEGDELLGKVGMAPVKPVVVDDDDSAEPVHVRRSPRTNKVIKQDDARVAAPRNPVVIDLGGTSTPPVDDDLEISHVQQAPPAPNSEDEESDEEFAELARQARARKKLQDEAQKSHTPDLKSPTPGQDVADRSRASYPTPPAPDPPVALFVSSRIPDTNPLLVYRKLSQSLGQIRKVWCQKQNFSEQRTQSIFLVYRRRKLYDVTTCRSIGLDVDLDGKIVMRGNEGADGVDRVALEAVDAEIWAQMQVEKQTEERKRIEERNRQDLGGAADDAQEGAAEAPAPAKEELIRIVLKSRDTKDPFLLKVKPSTVISKIVKACEGHFKLQDDQTLYLDFDGEQLDPDAFISDTEISDMDNIDVHIS